MTPRNVELYEALKPSIGEEAARMIAEVIPPAADLATKQDVAELRGEMLEKFGEVRTEFASVRGEMREGFAEVRAEFAKLRGEIADIHGGLRAEIATVHGGLRAEIHAESARMTKWMLGFFVPVWAGTWATVVAVLVKL